MSERGSYQKQREEDAEKPQLPPLRSLSNATGSRNSPPSSHASSYERPRRPYDAVLDASPPPSASSMMTEHPKRRQSAGFPDDGQQRRPDMASSGFKRSPERQTGYAATVQQPSPSQSSDYSQASTSNTILPPISTGRGVTYHADPVARNSPLLPSIQASAGPSFDGPARRPSVDTLPVSSASSGRQRPPEGSSASSEQSGSQSSLQIKRMLEGFSRCRNGWRYRLVVVQHPTRARMCGFGDKDRRPLSPTLIVKLIITDEQTGEEISPWRVNTSLFFLASDLCHPDDLMLSPRNVLVHQRAASIPTSMLQQQQPTMSTMHGEQQQQQHRAPPSILNPLDSNQRPPSPLRQYGTPTGASLPPLGSLYLSDRSRAGFAEGRSYQPSMGEEGSPFSSSTPAVTTVTTEHYTRNLVGAAVTSANVLRDEQDNYAIFFVLQDLSVRTEGVYRIRLLFTDLAQQDGQTNEGVSEALADAYTEPFSVYSPRRFPGMLEPTELSKKLASQGIKIAVRSDKKKRRRDSVDGGPQGAGGEGDEMDEDDE